MPEKDIAYKNKEMVYEWGQFYFHCEAEQGLEDIFLAAILTC